MWSTTIWHRLKPAVDRSKPMWVKQVRTTDQCSKHTLLYEGTNSRYKSVWYTQDDIDLQHISTEKTPASK